MQNLINSFNNSSYSQLTEILQNNPKECMPFCNWLVKKLELGEGKDKDWNSVIIAISNAMNSQFIEKEKEKLEESPDELVKKLISQIFSQESSLTSRIQNIRENISLFPTNTDIEKMAYSTLSHGLKQSAYCLCERMDPPSAYYFAKENGMDERFIEQLVEKMEPRTRELIDIALQINKDKLPLNKFLNSLSFSDLLALAPYLTYANYNDNEKGLLSSLSDEEIQKFLSECSRLETLVIISKVITSLPKLAKCKQLNCQYCLNLRQLPGDLSQCQELTFYECKRLDKLPDLINCQFLNCSYCKRLMELPNLPKCQTLVCRECKFEKLPELPNCQNLDCQFCKQLIQMPAELPSCQELNCIECNQLPQLPKLPRCQYVNCVGCKQLLQLPELPRCQELYCRGCKQLPQLPELPNCQRVDCAGCEQLAHMPAELPRCQELYCASCKQLPQLPELPNCQRVDCAGCEQLTHMPAELPRCQELNCNNCNQLVELSDLMNCQKLSCKNCPNLRLRNLNPDCQVTGKEVDLWQFKVKISDLEKRPESILIHLGKYLKKRRLPKIIFLEEDGRPSEGVDAGGLRRQLFNLFFKNLFNPEERKNKLPFERTSHGIYPQLFKSEKGEKEPPLNSNSLECYRSMGMLFAFAYVHGLLIGNQFNSSLFTAMTALSKEDLNTINSSSYDPLATSLFSIKNKLFFALQDPPQSFSLIKAIAVLSEGMLTKEELNFFETLTPFSTIPQPIPPSLQDKLLFTIQDPSVFWFINLILKNQLTTPRDQELEEKLRQKEWKQLVYFFQEIGVSEEILTQFINEYKLDQNSFEPLQDKMNEGISQLIEDNPRMPSILPAVTIITKEMSSLLKDSVWKEICLQGPTKLQDKIEGQLTPQLIIKQLKWEGESEEMKHFLTSWIKEKETDLKELQKKLIIDQLKSGDESEEIKQLIAWIEKEETPLERVKERVNKKLIVDQLKSGDESEEMKQLITWIENEETPLEKVKERVNKKLIVDQLKSGDESEEIKELIAWIEKEETPLKEVKEKLAIKNININLNQLNEKELDELSKQLQQENLKELGTFLTILTGSPTLTQDVELTIHLFNPDTPEKIPSCHSCNRLLELPIYKDKEIFDAKFQFFLDNALSGSGFQTR